MRRPGRALIGVLVVIATASVAARGERMRGLFHPDFGPIPPHLLRPVTPEEEDRALRFAREFDPRTVGQIAELQSKAPDRYNATIRRLLAMEHGAESLIARGDTTMFQFVREQNRNWLRYQLLEVIAESAAVRCRSTDDLAGRDSLRTELRGLLTEMFELRERGRGEEIRRIEERLRDMRRVLEERRRNRDAIVEHHLQQMLGERDTVEW